MDKLQTIYFSNAMKSFCSQAHFTVQVPFKLAQQFIYTEKDHIESFISKYSKINNKIRLRT